MSGSTEINDKFKISVEITLLKRMISHGYEIAFNSAASAEEEEFLLIRKNNNKEQLKRELRELKNLLG